MWSLPDNGAFERMLGYRNVTSVMHRLTIMYRRKLMIPGASENATLLILLTVPTSDTGALAEKAKTCKAKSTKGTRHISPVA